MTSRRVHPPERDSMRSGLPRRAQGFTLTEMVVAVAIAAILAFVAIPSYQETLRKSRRADAKVALEDLANRLERYYADKNTYVGATLSSSTSPQGYYTLSLAVPDATHFTITATRVPTGPQASDAKCGDFTLDQNGNQGVTVTGAAAECW